MTKNIEFPIIKQNILYILYFQNNTVDSWCCTVLTNQNWKQQYWATAKKLSTFYADHATVPHIYIYKSEQTKIYTKMKWTHNNTNFLLQRTFASCNKRTAELTQWNGPLRDQRWIHSDAEGCSVLKHIKDVVFQSHGKIHIDHEKLHITFLSYCSMGKWELQTRDWLETTWEISVFVLSNLHNTEQESRFYKGKAECHSVHIHKVRVQSLFPKSSSTIIPPFDATKIYAD
jgi:hypothetical protein